MSEFASGEVGPSTLAQLQDGDIAALAEIFAACGPRVYRLARRMMSNDADAEDTTQEIFLRAFEQAKKFNGRSRFSTWLYRLAVRHCLNKIEQRNRRMAFEPPGSHRLQPDPPAPTPSVLESLILTEEIAAADRALQSLNPAYRACLLLREVEGLSYSQIAEVLQIPAGTVMSRLSRAREELRARLKKLGDNEPAGNNPPGPVVQKDGGMVR